MDYYSKYWDLYNDLFKPSEIRQDEINFINAILINLDIIYNKKISSIVEYGCGDGRIVDYFAKLKNLEHITLVDTSDSVYIAYERVKNKSKNIDIIKTDFNHLNINFPKDSALIAIGLINYFRDQVLVLNNITKQKPPVIFLGVTGYSFRGKLYKLLNLIRGSFLNFILFYVFIVLNKLKFYFIKMNLTNSVLFRTIIKLMEPLIAKKIFRLSHNSYVKLLNERGYTLVGSEELGLCRWMVYVYNNQKVNPC